MTLTDFSAALVAAYETGDRVTPEGPVPQSHADAYAVQQDVMARFGPVGAYKVARKPGVAPIMAPIRADRIFVSDADVPIIDAAGIELEVGFEILSAIPAGATLAQITKAVRPRPVIEVVDTRIAGPLADDPIVKLADQQASGALVIGAPLPSWDGSDFTRVDAHLSGDATQVLEGAADVPAGSALTTVQTLAEMIGDHCGGLQPGMFVITGSLNGLPYFPIGTAVQGRIDGLGAVSCQLVA